MLLAALTAYNSQIRDVARNLLKGNLFRGSTNFARPDLGGI